MLQSFHIKNDKTYLSLMIDCFDIYFFLLWIIGLSLNAKLINTMLKDTISQLYDDKRSTTHSKRSADYSLSEWITILDNNSWIRLMSKEGCFPDNSAGRTLRKIKTKFYYYERDWNNITLNEFTEQLNTYIIWYNRKRIK